MIPAETHHGEEKEEGKLSRRGMLRWTVFSVAGAGIVLVGADGLIRAISKAHSQVTKGKTSTTSATLTSKSSSASATSLLKVKAVYFLMAQTIGISNEYFVLQSPAILQDLLSDVVKRHASLSTMLPNMQILIDGTPAEPIAPLKDGDEVGFIPLFAGG